MNRLAVVVSAMRAVLFVTLWEIGINALFVLVAVVFDSY